MKFDPELLVAVLAVSAAWVAALFAYRSFKVTKRALELAESESAAKKSNITAYLADSFRVVQQESGDSRYVFSIAYSNKSETNDSITEIQLETFYVNSANRLNHLISAHEPSSDQWLVGSAKPAILPINIPARSAMTNWFVFGIPAVAEDAKQIKKYRVVARNSIGQEAVVESYILRKIGI
jgi:hypothetical protein